MVYRVYREVAEHQFLGNIYITGNYNTIENILIKYNNQGGFYINGNYEISDNDTIQGVFIVDNLYGVFGAFINDSSINSVAVINDSSGTFSENGVGFVIGGNHNILENLTAKDNGYGMSLGGIDNILTDSIIENNSHYGLVLSHSQGDLIYNNIFNNTNNLDIILSWAYFNISLHQGINILGGNVIGGNAWLSPNGNGFSQTCSPMPSLQDICSKPYIIGVNSTDYYPLKYPQEINYTTTSITTTTTTSLPTTSSSSTTSTSQITTTSSTLTPTQTSNISTSSSTAPLISHKSSIMTIVIAVVVAVVVIAAAVIIIRRS
ncbi:MAG: hypothetical protein C0171_04060 [Caldisphaera sp.]|nr:MAG: hypothetical protein C0202_01695 [Caldisphaera sp.]PMP90946.1 MAG: hypothetical protein C0171_04060 [Caldisphaera sp.]